MLQCYLWFLWPLCNKHCCLAAHSLRAPKFSIFYPSCLYSLDACCREVVNVKYSLFQHLRFLVSESHSEPCEVERWCNPRVSLLLRTDVPGREGRNTDGGNGVWNFHPSVPPAACRKQLFPRCEESSWAGQFLKVRGGPGWGLGGCQGTTALPIRHAACSGPPFNIMREKIQR